MSRAQILIFWPVLIFFACLPSVVSAVYNPVDVPNNRIGVHILDPQELGSAAKLVNSNQGDWGYVTIPIRINDRDHDKWSDFFVQTRKLHIIPILRLATYPNGDIWVKPTVFDLVDFANFLYDMPWPTSNRYVIIFNEVNHANEWGGEVNPGEYATLLVEAHNIFKSRSVDFFLLSAGLDMSAPNSQTSQDAFTYYTNMTKFQPGWYASLDALSVHAYPNPGFSTPYYVNSRYSIHSYKFEQQFINSLGFSGKPIFITETGWPFDSPFFASAFNQVWQENNLVAVTPFLLNAAIGGFARFSLLDPIGQPKSTYQEIYRLPKITGSPLLSNLVISPAISMVLPATQPFTKPLFIDSIKTFLTRLRSPTTLPQITITINGVSLTVELATTPTQHKKGLSGRFSLAPNSGMLFNFPEPDNHAFWMKDMNFSLDFIWIRNGRAIQLSTNIPFTQPPVILTPNQPVDQILEVPAGFIDKNGIKVGDEVRRR